MVWDQTSSERLLNKVYADVVDSRLPHNAEGFPGPLGIVAAVHPLKQVIVQGLDADADAVHPQHLQAFHIGKAFLHNVFRIHLQGEFLVGASVAGLFQGQQDAG